MRRTTLPILVSGALLLGLATIDPAASQIAPADANRAGSDDDLVVAAATRPPRSTVRSIEDVVIPTRTPAASATPTPTETTELVPRIIAPIVPAAAATATKAPSEPVLPAEPAIPIQRPVGLREPSALPNLVVALDIPELGLIGDQPSAICAKVVNRTAVDVPLFDVQLNVDSRSVGTLSQTAGSLRRFDVDGDGEADGWRGCVDVTLPAGPHEVQAIADVDDDVDESDEGDNVATGVYQWASRSGAPVADLPDLYPSSWSVHSCAPGPPALRVGVANIGAGGATSGFAVRIWLDGAESPDHRDDNIEDGLAAGAAASAEFSLATLAEGPHTLRVLVDVTRQIGESDETNNGAAWTIACVPESENDNLP